ncbi:nitroreductase family protein [Methanospirillum lacunae]|uniref:4Fe-4S ferredoxin-type domain-containing protein n=1 Tax=Methanospirillum lacunae TaxID=668570 RepID=A0A2V2N3J9_9EURY|nr:nitroreductase family protein [Methanospirillum lacunae]PWR74732.1 hypothetical protein DK846_00335 [Methanospirillum lacunae]
MQVNFSIDSDRCNRCGICSNVCLSSILIQDPITKIPTVASDYKVFCTTCGHCESFCPQGAIKIETPEVEPFQGSSIDRKVSPETVKSLIVSRRTIRHFQDKPVSHDLLINLLDIIRYAPSGFNLHPVEWMIVKDPAVIQKLSSATIDWLRSLQEVNTPDEFAPLLPVISKIIAVWESGEDPVCYHAPALIIAHADTTIHSAGYDAIIALSYLDLIAQVYDLGTCWAGLLQMALSGSPDVLGLIPLPQGHTPHHVLLIGNPRYQIYQIPKRPLTRISVV